MRVAVAAAVHHPQIAPDPRLTGRVLGNESRCASLSVCRASFVKEWRSRLDFFSPGSQEELVQVVQPLLQDCVQGWFAEQIVDFAVPPVNQEITEASASGGHPRAHRDQWTRASQEVPTTEVAKKVDLALTLRRRCLRRRWHGRANRKMSSCRRWQDGTMKERQSEVFSRGSGRSWRSSCGTRACREPVLREQACFPLQRASIHPCSLCH